MVSYDCMASAPVDHEARRATLSHAVVELVAKDGLEAVSVRRVAAAAGVSIGTVQHYFPTKDAMLLHAHELVNAEVSARAEAAAGNAPSPRNALRAIILAVLPTDEESARIVRVFTAFETRAIHAPALAERARAADDELHQAFEHLLHLGGAANPRRNAIATMALLGGLCHLLLLDECSASDAADVVDAHLESMLPDTP